MPESLGRTLKKPIRILHVDDKADFFKVSKQCLETKGNFQIDTTISADEAFGKLRKKKYDAIVSDYKMPKKDGLEFLKELRDKRDNIPFIMFTGKGREEVAIQALNLGADRYIDKIGDPDTVYTELLHAVTSIVKSQKTEKEIESLAKFPSENPNPMLRLRKDSTVLYANEYAGKLMHNFGFEIGKRSTRFWQNLITEVLESQSNKTIDVKLHKQTHSFFIVPVIDAGYVNLYEIEMTRRKRAKEKIKKVSEKWEKVFEAISDIIFVTDKEFRIIRANKTTYDILKITPKELMGKFCFEVLHSRSNPWPNCPHKEMLMTKKPTKREISDPNLGLSLLVSVSPIFDDAGELIGGVHVAKDITERKKAEEALKEAEEKYRVLVENSPSLVAIYQDRRFVYVNKAMWEKFGWTFEEMTAPSFNLLEKIFPKRFQAKAKKNITKRLRGERISPHELSLKMKNGTEFPVIVHGQDILYKGKPAIEYVLVDVTERKRTVESLRNTMERLEMMNEKLDVVGRLTRHDVRNKLQAIANSLFMVEKNLGGDQEALEHLDEIKSASRQVEEIFDFARTYEMIGAEELKYVDVEKQVEGAVSIFPDMQGIEFANDCRRISVLADSLLQRLFSNLIDNSLRHGEKVSRIRVYCKKIKDGFELIYEDNGVGIPMSEKEKIFEESYGKGTGYGLYLVQRLVEVYGWTIKETGKQGKGARFTITIPKANEEGKAGYRIS